MSKIRTIDTLFGRLAALVVVVLMFPHIAWYLMMRVERTEMQNRYAVEEMVFLIEAVEQHQLINPNQPLPSRLKVMPLNSPDLPGVELPPILARFANDVAQRLPAGTQIRIDPPPHPPHLWILPPGGRQWFVLPMQPLHLIARSADRALVWLLTIFLLAVLLALFAAWQLQRPLRRLADAVMRFGRGLPVAPLSEGGPRELRQLTRGFNQMVADISQAEGDRGIMLAGVAHDLKTPLARMRLRAEMVDDDRMREGFVRDADSLAHIVDQFLVFAHDEADRSTAVEVDQMCERYARNFRSAWPARAPIELSLRAGAGFKLSAATLDRVLSNLLENAYAYGAPPVSIETWRDAGGWHLVVADHGLGIPLEQIADATRPFVRLDPARGGNAHCGLGLAIVARLARRAAGECAITNAPGSGLRVELTFPSSAPEKRVERSSGIAVDGLVRNA